MAEASDLAIKIKAGETILGVNGKSSVVLYIQKVEYK